MNKIFKTTLGLMITFVVLLQLSYSFTSGDRDEYTSYDSNYSNNYNGKEESSYADSSYNSQEETSYTDSSYDKELGTEEYEEDSSTYNYSNESKEDNEYSYYEEDNTDSYVEEERSVAHIGETAYISKANSYYHAISNCKYLEGASTSAVTVSNNIDKYECNCWYNPVEYVPSKQESSPESSSVTYVYISSGNSYYHKSSSCKFLNGASAQKVDINSASGKHACNCIKY